LIWDSIVGQEEAITQLREAIRNKELSHAYLFFGSGGTGKQLAAKAFAAAVNCPDQGCAKCLNCHKILNGLHPDVVFFEPEGNFFTIEQVRELQHEVGLKPFETQTKVYVLDEVDKMTREAANSLLKTLEEPPPHTIFILLTSNPDGLLSTVISRCQTVRFKPISKTTLANHLVEQCRLEEEDAELFARLSGGLLSKAIELATSDSKHDWRKSILTIIEGMSLSDSLDLADAAEGIVTEVKKSLDKLKKEQKKEIEGAQEIALNPAHTKKIKSVLNKKHKRRLGREERRGYDEALFVFSSWYRDLTVLRETNNPDLLVNVDCLDILKQQSMQISSANCQKAVAVIEETKRCFRMNVNPQLAMETMLFELKSLNQAG